MLMESLRLEKTPKITNVPSWEGQPQNWDTSRVVLGVLFPPPCAGAIPLSQQDVLCPATCAAPTFHRPATGQGQLVVLG